MHSEKLPSLSLFFLIFNLKCIQPLVSSSDLSLEFELNSFSISDFIFLGDSQLTDALMLTETVAPIPSWGCVFYAKPIQLLDPESRDMKSFTTSFVFSIQNVPSPSGDQSSRGDGFAFLLSPDIHFIGKPGFMGLIDSTAETKIKFVAIEFDIKKDSLFQDPDDNHVGLDISNLRSVQLETAYSVGIGLSSGQSITAWIEYRTQEKKLDVSMSYFNFKPDVPLLSVDIDLSEYIDEKMYVGFSASTEGTIQLTRIEEWKFSVLGLSSTPPPPPPKYIFRDPSESGKTHHPGSVIGLTVGAALTFSAILLMISWIGVKRWKLRTRKLKKAAYYVELRKHKPPREDSQEIRISTRNTDKSVDPYHCNKVGGRFKTVLKLKSLNHPNLVNVMNCLVQNGKVIVEYETDASISLDKVLFDEYNSHPLKWPYRYNIAGGLASALTYLHHQSDIQVIHGDIRSSNVLLDEFNNPQLTNFGLVTTGDRNCCLQMHTSGIMGYLAPEYFQGGKKTMAMDVYSYGVVMLELACGRRSIDIEPSNKKILVDWIWKLHSEGKITEAADKMLNDEFNEEEMRKLLLIGLSCANPDIAQRPSMMRVFQILNNEVEPMAGPKVKPSLASFKTLPLSMDGIILDDERCPNSDSC